MPGSPSYRSPRQPDNPPSYEDIEFENIELEPYTTLPSYSTILRDHAQRNDRRNRIRNKYDRWWRLRDSILTSALCVAVWAAYAAIWVWRKRREGKLSDDDQKFLPKLLNAQLPSVIFTIPTIGYLPIRWVYLPTIYKDSLTAFKTVPVDIVLLLGWGAITAATWMKTPFKVLGDSELAFYWGVCVSACIALSALSIFKTFMRMPCMMERKFGGQVDGEMKRYLAEAARNAVV